MEKSLLKYIIDVIHNYCFLTHPGLVQMPVSAQIPLSSFCWNPDDRHPIAHKSQHLTLNTSQSSSYPNPLCCHYKNNSLHNQQQVSTCLSSQLNFLPSGLSLPPPLLVFQCCLTQSVKFSQKSSPPLAPSTLLPWCVVPFAQHPLIFKTTKWHFSYAQNKSILTVFTVLPISFM